jgi:hypothetical protein
MEQIETDYLVIGSGAVGLAFADTLLDELPDVHVTIVDRHGKPVGHWNDAYSFVTLHQPSAFYGVNSMPLGSNREDTSGNNKGLYELAIGPEVSALNVCGSVHRRSAATVDHNAAFGTSTVESDWPQRDEDGPWK